MYKFEKGTQQKTPNKTAKGLYNILAELLGCKQGKISDLTKT